VDRTGERLGVFGGTFDPPHIGHFLVAVNALYALSLDRVLLVTSNIPWQKVGSRPISPAEDRLALVAAGVRDQAGLEASDLEIRLGGESSTVATLQHLRALDPTGQLFLIVGADVARGLRTWRRHEELPGLATLVVVDRETAGTDLAAPSASRPLVWPGPLVHLSVPRVDISSTELRRRVGAGEPIDYLVPAAVATLVEERLLYRGGP
jgi:nicotinate-nucleotide adenylyltransferase